jgi:hypothetical protein
MPGFFRISYNISTGHQSKYDGYYNYNACRVPWRIATDFIIGGDKRSREIVEKINTWIRETTQNNPIIFLQDIRWKAMISGPGILKP